MLIGRVFHDAGYQVEFATEPDDVVSRALGEKVRVVIVSADIEEKMESVCLRASSAGSGAAFIVNTPPKEILRMHARLADLSHCRLAVHDAFASSATLLFVTNELVNRPMVDFRESERLLYGATVRFRHAGRDDEEHGYLYNISGGGLYVRTLAPPERGDEVWLEFVPPRSDRRVHLEGAVAWARPFGPGFAATVPSGFGVKIDGGSPKDLARYQQSYRTFLAERAALLDTVLPVTREKSTLPAPTARSAL
jgi:Tfp pilus assembly protein PilZ